MDERKEHRMFCKTTTFKHTQWNTIQWLLDREDSLTQENKEFEHKANAFEKGFIEAGSMLVGYEKKIEELTINYNSMKDKLNRSVELNLTLQGKLTEQRTFDCLICPRCGTANSGKAKGMCMDIHILEDKLQKAEEANVEMGMRVARLLKQNALKGGL